MTFGQRANTVIEPGEFRRLPNGPRFITKEIGLPLRGLPAWRSNGGADRNDVERRLPFSLEMCPPDIEGILTRIHLVGCFALFPESGAEAPGTCGAVIQIGDSSSEGAKVQLVNGRHYCDANDLQAVNRLTGDGASVETIGECCIDGRPARVDLLTIDVPGGIEVAPVRFRDLGSPASFVIFDAMFEIKPVKGCPFKRRSGGVALAELGSVVRVGDRVRLRRALDQLEDAINTTEDLDEAKGQALTFIAVVSAAAIERGGTRAMHRIQLEAARILDSFVLREEIVAETRRIVDDIVSPLASGSGSPSGLLIDRALSVLNRNYARDITDEAIADQLGLSTSHFRFLFREVTGQPFHKYLIGLRLERAKSILLEGTMPVSEVAAAVGFNGLAHFSRAFTQRFSVSPTNLRRSAAGVPE